MTETTIRTIKKAMIDHGLRQADIARRLTKILGRKISDQKVCDVVHGRLKLPEIRRAITIMLNLDPSVWDDGS